MTIKEKCKYLASPSIVKEYSIKARAYLIIWLLLSRKKLGLLGSHRIGREAVSEAAISLLKGGKTFIVVARRDKIASSSSCRTPHVGKEGQRGEGESNTDFPAYSDTLGTWEKCHCNQIVTVTRGSLVTN